MADEGLPVQIATRVLAVSESGYYEHRSRGPSVRAVRHALLTDLIREVHQASRGTYGYRRVHAELTLGRGPGPRQGRAERVLTCDDMPVRVQVRARTRRHREGV